MCVSRALAQVDDYPPNRQPEIDDLASPEGSIVWSVSFGSDPSCRARSHWQWGACPVRSRLNFEPGSLLKSLLLQSFCFLRVLFLQGHSGRLADMSEV